MLDQEEPLNTINRVTRGRPRQWSAQKTCHLTQRPDDPSGEMTPHHYLTLTTFGTHYNQIIDVNHLSLITRKWWNSSWYCQHWTRVWMYIETSNSKTSS